MVVQQGKHVDAQQNFGFNARKSKRGRERGMIESVVV